MDVNVSAVIAKLSQQLADVLTQNAILQTQIEQMLEAAEKEEEE